ncbi:MAG: methyltransferase domain-containing protein [bacterium]
MEGHVAVIRGKRVEEVPGALLHARSAAYNGAIVDLGTGDGRWLFRFARRHPNLLCVGIDANPDLVEHVSRRALRGPERGGAPNLIFLRAAVAALPGSLIGLAGRVRIQYPWGTLLRSVIRPEVGPLSRIAAMLRPGGILELLVNVSAITDAAALAHSGLPARTLQAIREDMVSSYPSAGLMIRRWETVTLQPDSTWAGRLGQGRPLLTLRVEAHTSRRT